VQGSRFVATAAAAADRRQAMAFVEEIRKEFFDATHTAFAYRLGPAGADQRAHDDGEPSGTAGKPILTAIERAGVTGVVVTVTRYFGGTKLGTGGLVRAYGGAAAEALAAAEREIRVDRLLLRVTVPHPLIGAVLHVASRLDARVDGTAYDDLVHVTLAVRRSTIDDCSRRLMDQTNGAALLHLLPEPAPEEGGTAAPPPP
jgi:uncharacterized YigZ family protein